MLTVSAGYVAGFVDPEVSNRSDLFDVYVNLPDSEITISQSAKGGCLNSNLLPITVKDSLFKVKNALYLKNVTECRETLLPSPPSLSQCKHPPFFKQYDLSPI